MNRLKRFPHFRQNNVSDCGPTCLRMIARYYGVDYTAEMLRRHCHVSRRGVNMLGISEGAEHIGLDTVGMKMTFSQLAEEGVFPCILYWNQSHFVVCYGIERDKAGSYKIHISDPASQRLTYTQEEFERCWIGRRAEDKGCGVVLMLEPGDNWGKVEDEYRKNSRSILSFTRYFVPYRCMIGQLLLAMLVGSLIQMVLPFLSQAMVDQGINGRNLDIITLILLAQLGFFVATLSIDYIRSWIMLHMNSRIDIALISDFLIKLTAMPLQFFDSRMTGDILQRIGDHGRIKGFLLGNSMRIVFSIVNFIVYLGILAYYNTVVLVIFLVGNTLYVAWISFFMRYRRELDIKRFNQSALEQSKMIQLVQGMQDIKLNNSERQKRWEWERIQVKLFQIGLKGLRIGQVQQSGSVFFTQTTHILIYYIAAKAVVDGSMTLGMMMSLTYIIGQVSAPIGEFIGFAQSFQDAKISLERLNEIHSQDDEETDIDKKLVISATHALEIEDQLKGNIIILGGGTVGAEIALEQSLIHKNNVSIIELGDELATQGNMLYKIGLRQTMEKCESLTTYLNTQCTEVKDNSVIIKNEAGIIKEIPADKVIVCTGMKSLNILAESFYGITPNVTMIGDCVKPRKIMEAVFEGHSIALNL